MATVFHVPASKLIKAVAEYLKENVKEVKPPPWAAYVKSGVSRQRPPADPDWWYVRCASLLRRVYIEGPIGLTKLRIHYGGRKRGRMRPEHFAPAGGAIIRNALHQLEQAGLIERTPQGRVITPKGRSLLDRIAYRVAKELVKEIPELKKYLPPIEKKV